jgi:hypothetical protein
MCCDEIWEKIWDNDSTVFYSFIPFLLYMWGDAMNGKVNGGRTWLPALSDHNVFLYCNSLAALKKPNSGL